MSDLRRPISEYLKPTDHDRILARGEHVAAEWATMPDEEDPNLEAAFESVRDDVGHLIHCRWPPARG